MPQSSLYPVGLPALQASFAGMRPEEIRQAKIAFVRKAIADYEADTSQSTRVQIEQLLWLALTSLLSLGMFRQPLRTWHTIQDYDERQGYLGDAKRQILNAIELWRNDLVGEEFIIDGKKIEC